MTLTNRALANTTFLVGPEEDLATVDVYTIPTDDVINNLPTIDPGVIAAENKSLADEMAGGSKMLEGLPLKSNSLLAGAAKLKDSPSLFDKAKELAGSALNAVGGVGGLTKIAAAVAGPSLIARLGSGASGIPGMSGQGANLLSSALNTGALPAVLKNSLTSSIGGNLGSVANFGGIASKIMPSQIGSSYQMSNLINGITGSITPSSIVDKDATSRMISGLAMGAMSSGISNGFSSVTSLAGGDKSIISMAGLTSMNYAASTGNLGGLKDVVTSVGKGVVTGQAKSLMKTTASNWTTVSSPGQSSSDTFTQATETFAEMDDGWMRDDRFRTDDEGNTVTEKVVDLSVVRAGSSDFQYAMVAGAKSFPDQQSDLKFLSMSSMFPVTTPEDDLKRQFPLTATSFVTDSNPSPTTVSTSENVGDYYSAVTNDFVDKTNAQFSPAQLSADILADKKQAEKDAQHEAYLIWARKHLTVDGQPFVG